MVQPQLPGVCSEHHTVIKQPIGNKQGAFQQINTQIDVKSDQQDNRCISHIHVVYNITTIGYGPIIELFTLSLPHHMEVCILHTFDGEINAFYLH